VVINPILGLGLAGLLLFRNYHVTRDPDLGDRLGWIIISVYLLGGFIAYVFFAHELKLYASIVLFPILMYLVVLTGPKTEKKWDFSVAFLFLFVYSFLIVFRNADGQFTLNISNNVYGGARLVEFDPNNVFFKNATITALWVSTAVVTSYFIYFLNHRRTMFFIPMGLSVLMLVLTNTRTALFTALFMVSVIHLFRMGFKSSKVFTGFIAIIISVMVVWLGLMYFLPDVWMNMYTRFSEIGNQENDHGLGQRLYFWSESIQLIAENPLGLGHSYFFDRYHYSTHQDYLGQLLSVGILAGSFFFLFVIREVYQAFVFIRSRTLSVASFNWYMLSLSFLYLITSLNEQVNFSNKFWVAFYFVFLAKAKQERRRARYTHITHEVV
jgi:hypothetical protein